MGSWAVLSPAWRATSFALVSAAACLLLAAPLAPAGGSPGCETPPAFFGANLDGPVLDGSAALAPEVQAMARSGVQAVRIAMFWNVAQPYPGPDQVPPDQRARFRDEGGIPTDFTESDRLVAAIAARRLRVLPVVVRAPGWAALDPTSEYSPPREAGHYARFLGALARRYGPNGSFWSERPDVARRPIRDWQIWNEPNQRFFWTKQPFERRYVALLRAARAQLLRNDPGARVVLAGLVGRSWKGLAKIYAAGGRRLFDVAAVHPFTYRVANVLRIFGLFRRTMARAGDGSKPLVATEIAWPSAKGRKTTSTTGLETTEAEQAERLRSLYPKLIRLRAELRLESAWWYTWIHYDKPGGDPFAFAGLRRFTPSGVQDKPALADFRRIARRCGKPASLPGL